MVQISHRWPRPRTTAFPPHESSRFLPHLAKLLISNPKKCRELIGGSRKIEGISALVRVRPPIENPRGVTLHPNTTCPATLPTLQPIPAMTEWWECPPFPSKVNKHHEINLRAVCGANLVTLRSGFRPNFFVRMEHIPPHLSSS